MQLNGLKIIILTTKTKNMQLTAKFNRIIETKTGQGQNGQWTSISFMVDAENGNFVKHPVFETFNKPELTEGLKEGQEVTVHFDIDSKEYNGRFYNSVRAYRVDKGAQQQQAQQQSPNPFGQPPAATVENDGLPF